jgi:hypothetical protein
MASEKEETGIARTDRDSRELNGRPAVQPDVRRFTVEEMDRLVRVFRLLDSWDRALRPAKVRKAA